MFPCMEKLPFPRGTWKPSAEEKQTAAMAVRAQACVSPPRKTCRPSTSLCFSGSRAAGSLLQGQSSTSAHLPYKSPETQTASPQLSWALMMQQHLLHLMGWLVFHFLEAEIRGCPTIQQIQFSKLCFWSPPERAQSKLPPPKVQGVPRKKTISWRGFARFWLTSCAAEVFGTCHPTHHAGWGGRQSTTQQTGIHPQIHPAGQVL